MKTKASSDQINRKFEVSIIKGSSIVKRVEVFARDYADAGRFFKATHQAVKRYRVREITNGNDQHHGRTFRTLRAFGGFTAEKESV